MSAISTSYWQVMAWQAAVFSGLITAFLAVVQSITATGQRSRDLRWKKADAAGATGA